ncbi:MAG: tyrosine-type recombinase/integrase [bacterium]|nr:tyrosine-type recombinase/integrase [bacterium]
MNYNRVEDFIKFLKSQGRSHHTIIAYKKDINQFLEYLEENKIDKLETVTTQHISGFVQSLFKNGLSAKTVSRKINAIKTFFKFLTQETKVLKDNPALAISHPRLPDKGPRFLNKLEYRALRDVVRDNPRMYAVIELMLQTGIRIGEVARLRTSDLRGKKLYIQPFESHDGREVPLNKNAGRAIEEYLKVRPKSDNDYLFLTRKGTPLSVRNLRASIDRSFKKAGIEHAKVSDIRHTFIAQQLLRGTPVVVVSRIVGHKRTETTSRYLDYLKEYDTKDYVIHEL